MLNQAKRADAEKARQERIASGVAAVQELKNGNNPLAGQYVPLHKQLQARIEQEREAARRAESHELVQLQERQIVKVALQSRTQRYPITADDRELAVRYTSAVIGDDGIEHEIRVRAVGTLANMDKINLQIEKNAIERRKLKLMKQPRLHLHGHVPIGAAAKELIENDPSYIEFLRQKALVEDEAETIDGSVRPVDEFGDDVDDDDSGDDESGENNKYPTADKRCGTDGAHRIAGALRSPCEPGQVEAGSPFGVFGSEDYAGFD